MDVFQPLIAIRHDWYQHMNKQMEKFLEKYILPNLNQEEIQNLNRPIPRTEIETAIRNLPANKITKNHLIAEFEQWNSINDEENSFTTIQFSSVQSLSCV